MSRSSTPTSHVSTTERIVASALAIIWALCIFVFSSVSDGFLPVMFDGWLAYLIHILEFGLLGALVTIALTSPNTPLWKAALLGLAITLFYAVIDEVHLVWGMGRSLGWTYPLIDAVAAVVGVAASLFIKSRSVVRKSRSSKVR